MRSSISLLRHVPPVRLIPPIVSCAPLRLASPLCSLRLRHRGARAVPIACRSYASDAPATTSTFAPEKPTLPSFSLDGKVTIVTGGAQGLGLVMGKAIVTSGSHLAIVDMKKADAERQAQLLVEEVQKANPRLKVPNVTAHYADVSDEASVHACMQEVIATHSKVDNLVTSAGFVENIDAVDYPIDRMRRLWGVNVDGTYLFATAVARHLLERKAPGSMVLIGSMSGAIVNIPQPQAPYNISKAAVRHMAASLAVEWAKSNIRVNCISPGYMYTALTEKIMTENPHLRRIWNDMIPQGKMGVPDDLMGPVTFLLSDAARYVTGTELRVDGGYTII